MGYVVTAPLVLAKNELGGDLYLYEGASVPDGQTDDWISRHAGMITEVAGAPVDDDEPDDDEPEGEKPAGNASADEWRAYAVTQGVSQDEADGLNRDELRARFDG